MVQKIIQNSITISAPSSIVWKLLTNPEETKKYMFGCETVSEWTPGSDLLWKMIYEGKEFIAVKGKVIAIQHGKYLAYTVFDPNADMEDIPENYLTVTYELTHQNDDTVLKVTQGDYAKVADGERRYKEAFNNGEGWNPILVQIKQLAENP